jgi:hypothetical protein
MTPTYETYVVVYEHRTEFSDTARVNQATITIYGAGELRIRAELERLRPGHKDIVILDAALVRHRG